MQRRDTWSHLTIERAAQPLPLPEDRFRAWMSSQRIFISSVMDVEMTPYREAARNLIRRLGGIPVMWEEIAPLDRRPEEAFLDGVDSSNLLVLMLGKRYGVADATGASPTHKEERRAAERKIPRLLFTLQGVSSADRDVKVNDWVNSLYNVISGIAVSDPGHLAAVLENRLREAAARQDRLWIKLGDIVFPGTVQERFDGGRAEFTVHARVAELGVRTALRALAQPFGRSRADRLTWAMSSYPIDVQAVSSETEFAGEDSLRVVCATPQNWHGESSQHMSASMINGVSAEEMAALWGRRTFLGEPYSGRRSITDLVEGFTAPETESLPDVLEREQARGWLAEGLARLFLVEEVARRYGGKFSDLEVGPATATELRISGRFALGPAHRGSTQHVAAVLGSVPLR
jgi:hypothetical protein